MLASSSPRRAALLSEAGFEFETVPPCVAEKFDLDLTLRELTIWNAIRKGVSAARAHPDKIVLAADTLVALQDEIIGKPADLNEAAQILRRLSGITHEVCPGMIRAYGDRALFQRFRWRFIFAPIFLVVVCTTSFLWDLKSIVLIAFIWGVWHGMMQTYGFGRIYDAKVGSFAALTRRLDFALCGIWFATAVLLSSQRMTDTLDSYYSAGGPFIPPGLLRAAQQALRALAIAVAGVFWQILSGCGSAGSDQIL
ncbi:MAG: hypothetical protein DME75_11475 [Verrucomicrobia bacterium]|nr:MAG: hypothetical protein DME75_11475 [Verrucomicrobiota bacterium]